MLKVTGAIRKKETKVFKKKTLEKKEVVLCTRFERHAVM
jgi:hypothetical protein